jgi:hypothetical protein
MAEDVPRRPHSRANRQTNPRLNQIANLHVRSQFLWTGFPLHGARDGPLTGAVADGRWWRPGAVSGATRPCGASGTRYASMRGLLGAVLWERAVSVEASMCGALASAAGRSLPVAAEAAADAADSRAGGHGGTRRAGPQGHAVRRGGPNPASERTGSLPPSRQCRAGPAQEEIQAGCEKSPSRSAQPRVGCARSSRQVCLQEGR